MVVILFFFPETRFSRHCQESTTPVVGTDHSGFSAAIDAGKNPSAEHISPAVQRKTYIQELSLWSGIDKGSNFFRLFFRPWPMLCYPAVVYSFLTFASSLGWALSVLTTAASVYQTAPYNFSAGIQSLIYLPDFVGLLVGSVWGGYVTDIYSQWRARKTDGVFEPEYRLPLLILPFIAVPVGVLMYGFGAADQLSWAVGYFGNGFLNFGALALATTTLAYVVDCYYPVSSELLLLVLGLKNVFGFAFSYAIIPWISASGYRGAFGTMAGIQVFIVLWGLPLWYWGKGIRQRTASWKLIYC